MFKTYKYRFYPTKKQCNQLEQQFGCCRFLYNQYVSWFNTDYELWKSDHNHKSPKTPLVTSFKSQFDFLKTCDNAALAYARSNFERAVNDFHKSLKGKRKGKKLGPPQYKKKGKCEFTYRTADAHGTIRFSEDNTQIRIPKIGWINIIKHRDYSGAIKAVTVSRTKSYRYYVNIMVETEETVQPLKYLNKPNPAVVGLDMSLSEFCVSSNNEDDMITKYHRLYRSNEQKLKRLNRRLSRKELQPTGKYRFVEKWNKEVEIKRPSKNREKARIKLARLHEKISNQREDYIYKLARYFANKYDVIVVEGLNMQAMSKSLKLGKSVMDLGWGRFVNHLQHKCEELGCLLVKADKWYPSSKMCNHCGEVNKHLKLSDREWVCVECGAVIDRDRNAALNLRRYHNKICTAGTAGIYACGDEATTSIERLGQVLSTMHPDSCMNVGLEAGNTICEDRSPSL